MMKCFDEGTIQAFLDGELTDGMLEKVAHHLGVCDDCAMHVSKAEAEFAFLSENLEGELNVAVPSENLRNRIFAEIATLEQNRKPTFWQQLTAAFGLLKGFQISVPMVAGFAGLLVVIGLFIFTFNKQPKVEVKDATPKIEKEKTAVIASATPSSEIDTAPNKPSKTHDATRKPTPILAREVQTERKPLQIVKANFVANKTSKNPVKPPKKEVTPKVNDTRQDFIEGEETYIKTIDALSKDVDSKKDEVLRPSLRVGFERDLAVVNNAIASMQMAVRKNPKDESAKQVLFSSYQNKIDMLSSVANRPDLVAAK